MKKEFVLLVGLCTLGLCSLEVQALNPVLVTAPINENDIEDPPPGYEKINLQGSLMYGINPNAIVAGASNDDVYIGFNQVFGNVNISIYNETGGLIYSTVVNTDMQSTVIIPFSFAAKGTYIVELSNVAGYADGDFERN